MLTSEKNMLIDRIASAGVVGAGGGGFPTAFKFKSEQPINTIIVNGAECEPLLKVDQNLLARYPENILTALEAVMQACEAEDGVIAFKKKYGEAREAIEKLLADGSRPSIRIFYVDDAYPVGDEHVLVSNVTGKTIPAGELPLSVGAVVMNVETLFNVSRALEGYPVTDKYVTVNGAVNRPATFLAPLGITVGELIKAAGGATTNDFSLVLGGPCMGRIVTESEPVIKTTKGLLVIPKDHQLLGSFSRNLSRELKKALNVCCQCRKCTDLCPRYLLGHPLEPHKIMRAVSNMVADPKTLPQALLCSECGVCDLFACPFQLSPRQVNRYLKAEFVKSDFTPPKWTLSTPSPLPAISGDWSYQSLRQIPTERMINSLGVKIFDRRLEWAEDKLNVSVDQVRLPLKQHAGKPTVPIVKIGDSVAKGDLIASIPTGTLGADLHASISGLIHDIQDEIVIKGGV